MLRPLPFDDVKARIGDFAASTVLAPPQDVLTAIDLQAQATVATLKSDRRQPVY